MRISIDGGAMVNATRFGTYVFTENLVRALNQYDQSNNYVVYTLENQSQPESTHMQYKTLTPSAGWMKLRVPLEETLHPNDIFLALNQSLPLFTRAKSIGFSHGFSYHFFPQLYPDSAAKMTEQLKKLVRKTKTLVVSSTRVKEEVDVIFSDVKPNVVVLPFGIPYDFAQTQQPQPRQRFFLFSGMNHPIKNVNSLIVAFKQFAQHEDFYNYKLVLAGPFSELVQGEKQIVAMPNTTREQRLQLYATATAYVSSSLYESFNLPVLEALSQDTQVIGFESAIIPEMAKYVHTVKDTNEMAKRMYEIAVGNLDAKPHTDLRDNFSWQSYVNKLTQLY